MCHGQKLETLSIMECLPSTLLHPSTRISWHIYQATEFHGWLVFPCRPPGTAPRRPTCRLRWRRRTRRMSIGSCGGVIRRTRWTCASVLSKVRQKWCERWFFLNGFYRPCRALKPRVNLQVYPLVNIYITMENHHAINGENSLFRLGNFQSLCVCLPEGNYGSWCP